MMKIRHIAFLLMAVRSLAMGQNTDPVPVDLLHDAQRALTNVIIHDIFSPPVSSRIYVYSHMAAYEILAMHEPRYARLTGQVEDFPVIPVPPEDVSVPLAAVYAFLETGKRLVFSEQMMADSVAALLATTREKLSPETWTKSIAYARQVTDALMPWMSKDHYGETRKRRRYDFRNGAGKWMPTPPAYMAAVEPNWGRIRTLALDSGAQFSPPPPIAFSTDAESAFYAQASEVYYAVNNLTGAQRAIANFWDCNPFAVALHGHLMVSTKKLSPGGHWLSIAGIAARKTAADLATTSAAYTLTAIALFDGFISCWDEKYRSNLIRPETYINAHIDASWRPILQTPPFPEYTSGHSVISTAAATVLTAFFGDAFAFTDDSEVLFGYPPRHFNSFNEACNEAAISRLYGGIHYRQAIDEGQTQGRRVGETVLARVRLKN